MGTIDIVILAIIALFAFIGLKNGLIKELTSLVAIGLGIYIAIALSDKIGQWLSDGEMVGDSYAKIVAFAIIFIAVVVLVIIFAKLLNKFADAINAKWLNRLCGFIFGAGKGVAIVAGLCGMAAMIIAKMEINSIEMLDTSILYNDFCGFFDKMSEMIIK